MFLACSTGEGARPLLCMCYASESPTPLIATHCSAQVPQMANLGLNNVSHALPLAAMPGGPQQGGFLSGGSYHSAHGMQLQAPAPQVAMPQAYAAQVHISSNLLPLFSCSAPAACTPAILLP